MHSQSGSEGDINWSVQHVSDRKFHVLATNAITGEACLEPYECMYPALFGLDVADVQGINNLLDKVIAKVRVDPEKEEEHAEITEQ